MKRPRKFDLAALQQSGATPLMEAAFNDFEEAAALIIKFSKDNDDRLILNAQNAVRRLG